MHREINLIQEWKVVLKLRRLIKKYNPDILYMHSSKAGAWGRIASLGIKHVRIYNPHGWAFNMRCSSLKRNIYAFIERMLAPLCVKIVAISDYEKQSAMERHICREDKIQVIFNGIDFDEDLEEYVYPTRNELGIPEEAFVVGTVGRIDQQKAPDVFVKSMIMVKKKIPHAFFVMVGSGVQQEQIEKLIEENGLKESFLITGWTKKPLDYVQSFDIAMLLSRWEGFGLVLPEYMLMGKPIVAARVDAIPDIIKERENGLLVDVDDINAAYEAVIELYNNPGLCNKLVTQGKFDVDNRFNAERVAKEHEALFRNLAAGK